MKAWFEQKGSNQNVILPNENHTQIEGLLIVFVTIRGMEESTYKDDQNNNSHNWLKPDPGLFII